MIYHDTLLLTPIWRRIMAPQRQKFATQVDITLLTEIRRIAQEEGRQIQAVVEEALEAFIEQRRRERPRPHIMAYYQDSHERFASLYERLAQ
jgi:hypothetical protein